MPRSQRTSRRDEKFQNVGYEPAVIAAEQVIDLLTLQYRQPPRSQLNSSWPPCSTLKSAWARPTLTGSWASSRT